MKAKEREQHEEDDQPPAARHICSNVQEAESNILQVLVEKELLKDAEGDVQRQTGPRRAHTGLLLHAGSLFSK